MLRDLSAPETLPGVHEAAARLDRAIAARQRVVLYGDYDVDGVTSLALLERVLRRLGARVECFLPRRADEGYGISEAGLARCLGESQPELLVAVDCGTNSGVELGRVAREGVQTLVLDHHEPTGQPSPAHVVNPKLGSSFHYLCSVGVAFKVLHALLKRRMDAGIDLREYLDLVAIGTVADMVPLVEENRILVRRGLERIPHSSWPGVRALARKAAVGERPSGSDVGFRLGPRINAAGRLGTALDSLALLTTDVEEEALMLAERLELRNRERQTVERGVLAEAEAWVAESFDPGRDASIVAGARDWHPGVLGIVASRLMRKHHRPAVVIGFDALGGGRGSGRSPEGFSLVGALHRCADLLEAFGGHALAAGLSIQECKLGEFRAAFETYAREAASTGIFAPTLGIDADLQPPEINDRFLEEQDRLGPFGCGNPQPVFCARAVAPSAPPRILKDKHLKFEFGAGRTRTPAIFFHGAESPLPRAPWDVAFRVEANTFRGEVVPQMHVIALRTAV
jgi:single-stranded-DNA-specific exonuclease